MQKSDEPQPDPEYFEMNARRVAHLEDIDVEFATQIQQQHRKGQQEHGGDLWRKACFARLKPEIIDMFTYAFEHEQRMVKWLKYLDTALKGHMEATSKHLVELVQEQIRLELSAETAEEVFTE